MRLKIIKTDMPFAMMAMEADIDYLLARLIHFSDSHFFARAGYFSQMTCEKYLKALTIQHNGTYASNTHKLLELAALCEPIDPYFGQAETKRVLELFDMFDQLGRYGAAANYDPLSMGKSVGGINIKVGSGTQVAGLMMWESKNLDELDGFVFKARSLLDFKKIKWGDYLQDTLHGKTPWKIALTRSNRYFKA